MVEALSAEPNKAAHKGGFVLTPEIISGIVEEYGMER
jgi:hypothetical protein